MAKVTNRHITLWTILILLILTFAGFMAYIFWNTTKETEKSESEKKAWYRIQKFNNEMQLDSMMLAFDDYLQNFQKGAHFQKVNELKQNIEDELNDWSVVRYSDSIEEVDQFIQKHSNGFFRNYANMLLDSLCFFEAVDEDTYSSYETYLNSFENGIFTEEARERMDNIDNGEVTEKETINASEIVIQHFKALASQDVESLKSTVDDVLYTYIGKSNITPVDVVNYMNTIHANKNRQIEFVIKNIIISKEVEEHIPTYSAHFLLIETIIQDGKTSQLSFSGLSKINANGKMIALILSQY